MTNPDALVAEAGARLHDAAKRLPVALRAIAAAMPGYPSTSGGGGGGTSELTVVEALAMSLGRDEAHRARQALATDLRRACVEACHLAALAGLLPFRGVPGRPSDDVDMRYALQWAVRAADELGAVRLPHGALRPATALLGASTGVYGVVGAWAGQRRRPADVQAAVAPSEVWCSHCREHGVMSPRDRRGGRSHGTTCTWCATYRASSGHLPPGALVKLHGEGRRVTVADVRRHDPEHARRLGAA